MTEYNLHQMIIFSMSGMKFGISVSKSELKKKCKQKKYAKHSYQLRHCCT